MRLLVLETPDPVKKIMSSGDASVLVLQLDDKIVRRCRRYSIVTVAQLSDLQNRTIGVIAGLTCGEVEQLRRKIREHCDNYDPLERRLVIPEDSALAPIEVLGLSERARNALNRSGCTLLGHLMGLGVRELMKMPQISRKTANEVFRTVISIQFTKDSVPARDSSMTPPTDQSVLMTPSSVLDLCRPTRQSRSSSTAARRG